MSDSGRVLLGSWHCASGNTVDVFLLLDARGAWDLGFEWTSPPPLIPSDQRDYDRRIFPAIVRRTQEHLEGVGRGPVGPSRVAAAHALELLPQARSGLSRTGAELRHPSAKA